VAKPSERGLRHDLDALRGDDDADEFDVRTEWRDAAPEVRPDGVTWQPPGDDEPALLAYDVWDAQRQVLDGIEDGHDIVAALAGYGSGKSVLGARWLLTTALENPGSQFIAMGQSFAEARDTTFRVLFEQLPGERTALRTSGYNGPESSPIVSDYNRQERRLTLINDAEIVLGSADKYSRFAGASVGGVWLDEPSHYGDELHDLTGMMTTRLRGVEGPKVQLWTLTGEGYNAAWEILEQRQDADGEDIGLDIEVLTASVLDNPYLSDADKERFKRKYAGTEKEDQALHGGFAAASGLVYSDFSRDDHVIDHADAVERVDDTWRAYGYDAGWRDPRVLVEFGRTAHDQLVALDEFYETEVKVERAVGWLEGRPKGRIYAEHAPGDIDRLKNAGHRVEKAEKDIEDGINQVRERLATDADGRPGLLISENCENLIRELLGYKTEHVGKTGAEDHAADVTRYVCAGEVTLSRRGGMVDISDVFSPVSGGTNSRGGGW
jgi:hypothetical protein